MVSCSDDAQPIFWECIKSLYSYFYLFKLCECGYDDVVILLLNLPRLSCFSSLLRGEGLGVRSINRHVRESCSKPFSLNRWIEYLRITSVVFCDAWLSIFRIREDKVSSRASIIIPLSEFKKDSSENQSFESLAPSYISLVFVGPVPHISCRRVRIHDEFRIFSDFRSMCETRTWDKYEIIVWKIELFYTFCHKKQAQSLISSEIINFLCRKRKNLCMYLFFWEIRSDLFLVVDECKEIGLGEHF